MKFLNKIDLNLILILPLAVLCIQWLYDGKYIAFILSLLFAFVLYGVIDDDKALTSDEEE
jgi:UDP-N-acetylmuramyl pentapeptide phosphotransferase/UDP-N-acetylglucosamine-1-phosphate transferase